MKLRLLSGRETQVTPAKYRIDWDRKVSGPQKAVKDFLRPFWDKPGVVVTEETPIKWRPGVKMRIDLINWNRRIAVEVSPSSSHSFNRFFHKHQARFAQAVGRDLDKCEWAKANGFTLVEIFDEDMAKLSRDWFLQLDPPVTL